MGTQGGGISLFDGHTFTTYTQKEGLSSNYINCLFTDNKHRVWIGTKSGLCYFENDTIKAVADVGRNISINGISQDNHDSIWVASSKGLFSITNRQLVPKFASVFKDEKNQTSCLLQDSLGTWWVGTRNGLCAVNINGEAQWFNTQNGLSGNIIESLALDANGALWVGTYGNGLSRINHNKARSFNKPTNLSEASVLSIFIDKKQTLWLATQKKGVVQFNSLDSSLSILNESNGLANNHVRSSFKDRWSNFWIGTSGGGVSQYTGQQFNRYGKGSGFKGDYIYTVSADADSSIWIGTSGGGLGHLSENSYQHYGVDSGFVDEKVRAIFRDSEGLLWVGTEGKGLAIFNGDTFNMLTTQQGLAGNWIRSITQDRRDNIWVASTGGGITKINKGDSLEDFTFQKFTLRNGLPSNRVVQLHTDSLNRVWFATQTHGLGCLWGDSLFGQWSQKEGLLSNDVRSLAEDKQGNLWLGTNNGLQKLAIYKVRPKLENPELPELPSTNIYQLLIANQQIWLGTEKGLTRLHFNQNQEIVEQVHFGNDEGFSGVETNLNASCIDRENKLWFGTINGLYRYIGLRQKNTIAPPLHFKSIEVNHSPLKPSKGNVSFDYQQNNISFQFLGINQTIPTKVKYRWRLVGLQPNWTPPSAQNAINYSNLSPGKYQFEVLAANENNIWTKKPLRFEFEITAPFWQKTGFKIAAALLLILVLIGFILFRFKRIKQKAKAKQKQLKLERDLLALEQKALQLQMNPHFIFHTLNNIQNLISKQDEATARKYLSKFSKLMRQILENSRSSSISLSTEIETLNNYLALEQFCVDFNFEFSIEVDQSLEVDFIEIPPMLLQPFVENAIMHGVSGKDKNGKINIHFSEQKQQLHCTIVDNGIGRKAAAKKVAPGHQSTALKVTAERIKKRNKTTEYIKTTDLFDTDGSPAGTQVVILLDLD